MNMWGLQIANLDHHLEVMASGGYKTPEEKTNAVRDDVEEFVNGAGVYGVTAVDVANELCITVPSARHHINILMASGAITMINDCPRRFTSNDVGTPLVTESMARAEENRAKAREKGRELSRSIRAKNLSKVLTAVQRAKLISTGQLILALPEISASPIRTCLNHLLAEGKITKRTGARRMSWWSPK